MTICVEDLYDLGGVPELNESGIICCTCGYGRTVFLIHGTWLTNLDNWAGRGEPIFSATYKAFGAKGRPYEEFGWSGGNYRGHRTAAAHLLIRRIRVERARVNADARIPITLVGHSHGGNVAIEAINMMVSGEYRDEFRGVRMNLMTLNTPRRRDYQLTPEARLRTKHIHVFNRRDIVQVFGGNWIVVRRDRAHIRGWGEYGIVLRRRFRGAVNVRDRRWRGGIVERHQSNNHVSNWEDRMIRALEERANRKK